ncbi:MAG TPA: hypothetical protein PK653_04785, partial [Syntrophales bacterium]|nr:hypothetical protein [Syntrophales bacterium]
MGTDFSRTEVTVAGKMVCSQGRSDEGFRAGDQMRQGSELELGGGRGTDYIYESQGDYHQHRGSKPHLYLIDISGVFVFQCFSGHGVRVP